MCPPFFSLFSSFHGGRSEENLKECLSLFFFFSLSSSCCKGRPRTARSEAAKSPPLPLGEPKKRKVRDILPFPFSCLAALRRRQ